MDKKQLAEMIKRLHKNKLEEIIGKPGPFNPAHHKATHGEDPESPNQYAHKLEEGRMQRPSLGPKRARRKSVYKATLGALEKRRWGGNQSQRARYTEEELKLGKTDTGQNSETVDLNPNIPTAKGETTKNTTVKETKEK